MSNLFNHTVQPLGSSKSPVEDLAIEVAEAFDNLENVVDTSTSTIVSITDALGNPLFQDINKHKVTRDLLETHTLLPDSSDIVLENEPEIENITVSYQDLDTLDRVNLVLIEANEDFTNSDQFKVKGKVLHLNVRVPEDSSLTVSVNYRTETFGLNDSKFLSNVIKKENDVFLIEPIEISEGVLSLNYEVNLLDNLDAYIIDSQESLNFFYTLDGETFNKLSVENYSIKESSIEITTDSLDVSGNPLILTYIENTSVSELLNALYYEFKNHDHSNHNITKNIDVKDLVNRFINSDLINYKSGDVPNYQFPQYFNREGHNENLDSVYENSILGTIFLSRLITDSVQKFKGLDEDSNKIVFGDPDLGHNLKYSAEERALLVDSVENLNGLNIQINSEDEYNLKLNGSEITSGLSKGLSLRPESNILNLVSEEEFSKYTFKFDNSDSRGLSVLDNIRTNDVSINNISIKRDEDTNSVLIDYIESEGAEETTKLNVIPEIIAKKITVETLNSTEKVSFNSISIDKLMFEPVVFTKTPTGVVVTNNGEENLNLDYQLPVNFSEAAVEELTSRNLVTDSLKIKDITLRKSEDPTDNNLYVDSQNPESSVNFNSKVNFENLNAETSNLKKVLTDFLGIGEIDLIKNEFDDLEIVSSTGSSKVIFKSPVEFLDVTSSLDSKINLDMLLSKLIKIGRHSFKEESDGSVLVFPDENYSESPIHFESRLEVDNLNPKTIDGQESVAYLNDLTAGEFKVGSTKVTKDINNDMVFLPVDETAGSKLIFKSDTLAHKLEAINLKVGNFDADSFNIGGMSGRKDTDGNLVFSSTDSATPRKTIFSEETLLNKAGIQELDAANIRITKAIANNIQFGNVALKKDPLSNSLLIINELESEVVSELKLKLPTIIDDLKVKNLTGILQASFEALNIHGFYFKKELNTDNFELNNTNPENIFKLKSKTEASDLLAKIFSVNQFNLKQSSKIVASEFNYLTNGDGNFEFVLDKAINIAGSSRSSGLSFSFETGRPSVYSQYISTNSGGFAIDAEKNMFIELDTTDGLFLISPTDSQITKKGSSYGFNDPTADVNISDLRKWFRRDIGVGNIDANHINLSVGDNLNRNGLSIGDTRISVIGPGGDCPDGLTTFESEESVHFVAPLNENQEGCKNLIYQEINTAGLNVNGELSVDGNASITESILVNDTVAAGKLAVTNYAELPDTVLSGTLSVSGETTFLAPISFRNVMTLSNDLVSSGGVVAKTLDIKNNANIDKDLKVAGSVSVQSDLKVEGTLDVQKGMSVNGLLKTEILNTSDLRSETLSLLGDASIAGTTTLQGRVEMKSSSQVQGNFDITNALSVRESITADNIFTLKDATIAGTLRAKNAVEFEGRSISIGSDASVVQLNGKLQFNTQDVTFNSPVKIFNTVRITDDTEIAGTLTNKSGIKAESYIEAKGLISTESTLETKSNLVARTALIQQNLEVVGSIISNSLTAESIAIRSSASVANLTISSSLSMPVDTSIVAGEVKFATITQTNSASSNNFAGNLSVSKDVQFLSNLEVGQNLIFNEGAVTLNSNGLKGTDAKVDVSDIIVNEIKGRERVQPPADLVASKAPGAASLSNTISQRDFVRMDHIISEGISIFNQPLIASTIYYRDLIYVGDESNALGSVNILARRALYA